MGQLSSVGGILAAIKALLPAALAAGGGLKVEGVAGGVAIPVSGAGGTQYAEDAAHSSGNTGTMALVVRADTAAATAANGDYVPLLVDANGKLWISPPPLLAKRLATGDTEVLADAAGNLMVSLGTKLDAANDAVKTVAGAVNSSCVTGNPAVISDTNATAVIAAQGAGVKIYLTSLVVTNSDATVGTLVTIQDGADTPVVLCKGYAAPAGGGFAITFPTPPSTTANKALNAICGTTSAEVYVSAVGFTAA